MLIFVIFFVFWGVCWNFGYLVVLNVLWRMFGSVVIDRGEVLGFFWVFFRKRFFFDSSFSG